MAIGLATALNMIVAAILYDAIRHPASAGISENATQILTGWGGGVIGILGAVFGYRAGRDMASMDVPGTGPGAGAGVSGTVGNLGTLAPDGRESGHGAGGAGGEGGNGLDSE